MAEPIVALIAIPVCYFLWLVADSALDSDSTFFVKCGLGCVIAGAGLYSLIRFIHWAWITPMPWMQ